MQSMWFKLNIPVNIVGQKRERVSKYLLQRHVWGGKTGDIDEHW